jgi:hypothetical protein
MRTTNHNPVSEMTVSEACRAILGPVSDDFWACKGEKWTVLIAMAAARTSDDPHAIETLREHCEAQRLREPPTPI